MDYDKSIVIKNVILKTFGSAYSTFLGSNLKEDHIGSVGSFVFQNLSSESTEGHLKMNVEQE